MNIKQTVIFKSQEAATAALPPCPRPKGGQFGHWWYIDSDRIEDEPAEFIPCVCGTCGQEMKLSVDAPDYPGC